MVGKVVFARIEIYDLSGEWAGEVKGDGANRASEINIKIHP